MVRSSDDPPPKAEMLAAIRDYLRGRVGPADMPKRILSVRRLNGDRYEVVVEMVVGRGAFEVWKEDGTWTVRGLPAPS